jgi:glycosyltransferase involved in cell wall biosynthesis
MPPFSRHAIRRDWAGLEEFYNPDGVFEAVHLVSLGDDHRYHQRRFGSSIVVHPVRNVPGLRRLGQTAFFLIYSLALGTAVTLWTALRERADVLWQRYASPVSHGIPCVVAGTLLRRPVVVTLNNDYDETAKVAAHRPFRRWLDERLWRFALRRANAVVAVSDGIKGFARRYGLEPERIVTIPNKEFYRQKFGAPPSPEDARAVEEIVGSGVGCVVVTVARLVEQKNLPNLVAAIARVAREHRDLVWVLVGQGPLEADVQRRVAEAGIERQVRLVAFLPHRRLAALFHRADAMLFATRFEGQGRVIVEAMAAGLPVIGSNQSPFTDMIINEQTGLLVDPDDVMEIARALDHVVADERLRRAMAHRCVGVAERYEVGRINPLERDLFERVLWR